MTLDKKYILLVDDEAELRELIRYFLVRSGYDVLEAGGGRAAFEIIKNQTVDLVLSDINMPEGNGIELLQKIKSLSSDVPVILFLTGFTDASVEEVYKMGAEALFAKPFDHSVLLHTINYCLEMKDRGWRPQRWRGETQLPMQFKSIGFEGAAQGLNLGTGGMFIGGCNVLPQVGEKISFHIQAFEPEGMEIRGEAEVKWLRTGKNGEFPVGFGVEFSNSEPKTISRIYELVNFLKTKQMISKK